MPLPRRDRTILAAALGLAAAVPFAAHRYLAGRIRHGLAPAATALCGEPVTIDHVEAGLTGTVRITGLAIGDVASADAVEASVGWAGLSSGQLHPDEIRIERPRVAAHVDGRGDSDLARLVRRAWARRPHRPGAGGGPGRLRRIVVTEGALVVDVVGRGRLEADGVELHPEPGGARVVTGQVRATGRLGPFTVHARFARGAADLGLPEPAIGRLLAVAGDVELSAGGAPLELHHATLGRGLGGGTAITLDAVASDGGVPRPVALTAVPGGGGAVHVDADGLPLAAFAPLAPRALRLGGAHATGGLTLARTGGALRVDAALDLTGAELASRAVADRPVALDGRLALGASLAGRMIDVDALTLARGALTVRAHGRLRRGGLAGLSAGDVSLAIDRAPCLAQLESLPAALRGPLDGLTLAGDAAASAHLRFDLDLPPGDAVDLDVDVDTAACQVLADAPGADPRALAGAAEHTFPDGSRAVVGPGVGDWVALADLPAHVDGAFRAAEDGRFFDHHGFDPVQIARSLEVDLREGRFARGGSTISQQLVKNEFLSQARTAARKLEEAVLTWRLEAILPKRAILARYLNVIELGPHVFGVSAAARYWFGKPATELDVGEAAFLAAMTSEPTSMTRRIVRAGGLDAESADRVDAVLRAMRRDGVIDQRQLDRARRRPLVLRDGALRPSR